jgi:hypothetical protein
MSRPAGLWRSVADHFEPDEAVDPKAQRQLRGQLEQIDYASYAANRKLLAALGRADSQKFERLALATAVARTQWIAAALAATDGGHPPTREQIEQIAHLREAFEELSEAYAALRRLVERGYLAYAGAQPKGSAA